MSSLERGALWPGYLVISLKGRGVARLLNLTTQNDIHFWDLRYRENVVTVKIRPRDFKKLRPLLRKTSCSVRILQKKGTPFVILQGWRRKGLMIGIVLFCLIIYTLSLFVWRINIEGNEDVTCEEIIAVLEKYGVREGALKSALDLKEIERNLLLEIEELKWAGVSLEGAYMNIQIVERLMEPLADESMDLFAAKDGLVMDILVLAGQAAVEPGDTVKKGDLLISGKMSLAPYGEEDAEDPEGSEGSTVEVKARGMVEALVWYETYAEAPLKRVLKNKTGNISRSFSILVGDKRYHLWGPEESPYRNYEMEKIKRTFVWRNLRLPVELFSNVYWEYEVEILPVSPYEALDQARDAALKEINSLLPRGAAIRKRYVDDYYFYEFGKVGCRAVVETLEDIAVSQMPVGRDFFS